MYWSVRRELWENRSIYVAPLAVAGVALFAFSLSSIAGIWEKPLRLNPAQPQAPYDIAAGLMMLTGIVVSVFYCLDALHGERRDRSILFWKSLPVSDLTTVLAKASIPLVILPLLTFAIIVAMQWLMLLMSSVVLLVSGQSVATLWTELSFLRRSWLLLYHLLTARTRSEPHQFIAGCRLCPDGPAARRFYGRLPLVAVPGRADCLHTWYFAALVGSRLIGTGPLPPRRRQICSQPTQ
jgi:ABC-2 type transport system permease protein